jgi:hypothetical protein
MRERITGGQQWIGMKSLKSISAVVMRRITSVLLLVPAVLVTATAMSGQQPAVAVLLLLGESAPWGTSESEAAFKQLASLVGEWQAIQDGVPIKETYTLTANGTVLMSQTKPADSGAMITMFTVDGDHLIAAHYCVAGNQPQMVTGIPGDLKKGVTFSLERVTGMKTPDDWHNTGLTVTLDDKDHMTQRWTYLYKGKTGTTTFHYTRKK